jgi:hypothetical protein
MPISLTGSEPYTTSAVANQQTRIIAIIHELHGILLSDAVKAASLLQMRLTQQAARKRVNTI